MHDNPIPGWVAKALARTAEAAVLFLALTRARLRRSARWIARAAFNRFGDSGQLSPDQIAWLLEDVEADLAAMVDDAENRGVTERAAKEMLVIRLLVSWLEGDGALPGAEAIEYLERSVRVIPRNPGKDELAFRKIYLAAIGALGGDEQAASRLWREPSGSPEQIRRLLDFQGRRMRELMEERGLSVGELAGQTGIDTVTLVSILFGLEEMRAVEWARLSKALDDPLDDLVDGHLLSSPAEDDRGSSGEEARIGCDRRGRGSDR